MSINAIEVLEARFANREQDHPYHSPEWWDVLWKKHNAWRDGTYPTPAGTGWECTPATSVEISFGSEVQMLEPFPVKPVILG